MIEFKRGDKLEFVKTKYFKSFYHSDIFIDYIENGGKHLEFVKNTYTTHSFGNECRFGQDYHETEYFRVDELKKVKKFLEDV